MCQRGNKAEENCINQILVPKYDCMVVILLGHQKLGLPVPCKQVTVHDKGQQSEFEKTIGFHSFLKNSKCLGFFILLVKNFKNKEKEKNLGKF